MTLTSRLISDVSFIGNNRKAHNTCYVVGLRSLSSIPEEYKFVVKNLRLWGVFCPTCGSIVFHAVKRSDCERFIKSAPVAFRSSFIVRFDSAY